MTSAERSRRLRLAQAALVHIAEELRDLDLADLELRVAGVANECGVLARDDEPTQELPVPLPEE